MPKDNGYSFGTPREIDALKALEKRYMAKDKLNNGLFIEVKPTGSKVWLYRYTYNGKQERLTIGRYPDISLKDARAIRDETASLVAKGISPKLEQEKNTKHQITFRHYGEQYIKEVVLKDRATTAIMELYLNNDIYPVIGDLAFSQITIEHIRSIIWKKKDEGKDPTAWQIRGLLSRMFEYAITKGLAEYNLVLAIQAKHVYKAKPRNRHLAITEIRVFYTTLFEMPKIQESYKLGLLLSLLTLLRKSELTNAKWEHIDFEQNTWLVPNPKSDNNGLTRSMVVYLSEQMIDILKKLQQINSESPYIFAGRFNHSPISHNTLNSAQEKAMLKANVEHFTIHDLRRTASTILNEQGFNADVIEKCLNHKATGVRAVYNKAEYANERKKMMQKWSDFVFSTIYEQNLIFFNQVKSNQAG
ncbi:tyrosine-type recombinase/integrase [Acinetobacter sichuanensis]|uniref:tyrosine-type recombinase/integrase n=1 Tax=Acinetobacter sichuanensis TaxID=2136183 RepID=UPI0028100923|nr:tyrosine-type recombinase/integrase [Acinetobacter sichuanensis]MDQ9021760.1 tyrosine-type recombinase/integrase [Acinetobacter sichuanensis]